MTVVDSLIKHEFNNPQADDPGPHDHTLISDWNNGHILSGGAADGDILTWQGANVSKGKFRTIVAGAGISVAITSTQVTIGLSGGVIGPSAGGTGLDTSASNGVPSINAGTWIINNVLTTNRVLLAAAGNTITSSANFTFDGNSFVVNAAGPHAIGGTTAVNVALYLKGTFASGAGTGTGTRFEHAVSPVAGADGCTIIVAGTLNKAASGTHADFIGVRLDPPTIGAGASTLTNASTLKITGAPSGATNNFGLWATGGSFRFDLSGPHGIGGAPDPDVQLFVRGSFTPTGTGVSFGARFAGTQNPTANNDGSVVSLAGQVTRAGSGTHVNFNGLLIDPPTIGAGAATVTNATSLKITAAPSVGTTQRALWVAGGITELDGLVGIGSTPTVPLDITTTNATANVRVTDSTNGARIRTVAATCTVDLYNSGGAGQFMVVSNHSMNFYTNNILRMTINNTGNAGYNVAPQGSVLFDVAGSYTPAAPNQVEGLSCRATLSPNGNNNAFGGVYLPTLAIGTSASPLAVGMFVGSTSTVGAGSITTAISLYVDPPTGAAATNAASLYVANGPSNGTSVNYAVWVDAGTTRLDGQVTLPAYASHVIGALAGSTGIGLYMTSSFASGQAFARAFQIDTTMTANADGGSLVGIYLNPTLTERAAGTHPIMAGMYVAPTMTAGAANTTDAAGVLIDTFASTTGTTNASGLKVVVPTGSATNIFGIWTTGITRVDLHVRTTAPNTRTDAGNAYTLVDSDNYIIVNKAAIFTLTLPTASTNTGRAIWVQTYTANTVVSATSNVVPKGGGAAGTAILPATQGAWALLVSDATNWVIMSSGT